jgi:hypothetical protein
MNANLKARLWRETKSFFVIFLYVWAILALMALHKSFLLQQGPLSGQLFAVINAAILGKVILILEMLKVGRGLQRHAVIWRILGKSMAYGLLLLGFHVVDEGVRGWFHHKSFADSIAGIDGGKFLEMGTLAVITMVALVPYFFLREIIGAIGLPMLQEILLGRPAVDAKPPA